MMKMKKNKSDQKASDSLGRRKGFAGDVLIGAKLLEGWNGVHVGHEATRQGMKAVHD